MLQDTKNKISMIASDPAYGTLGLWVKAFALGIRWADGSLTELGKFGCGGVAELGNAAIGNHLPDVRV